MEMKMDAIVRRGLDDNARSYLTHKVLTVLRPSEIHGVGLFAAVDIPEGEEAFGRWEGPTVKYYVSMEEFGRLPDHVQTLLTAQYFNSSDSTRWFRLYQDSYMGIHDISRYLNTNGRGNVVGTDGRATEFIPKGAELLGRYRLENTLRE